jgi:hypothetical protein
MIESFLRAIDASDFDNCLRQLEEAQSARSAKASSAFAQSAFESRPAGREAYRTWDLSSSHTPDTAEDSKPTAELPLLLHPVAALQPRISAAEQS